MSERRGEKGKASTAARLEASWDYSSWNRHSENRKRRREWAGTKEKEKKAAAAPSLSPPLSPRTTATTTKVRGESVAASVKSGRECVNPHWLVPWLISGPNKTGATTRKLVISPAEVGWCWKRGREEERKKRSTEEKKAAGGSRGSFQMLSSLSLSLSLSFFFRVRLCQSRSLSLSLSLTVLSATESVDAPIFLAPNEGSTKQQRRRQQRHQKPAAVVSNDALQVPRASLSLSLVAACEPAYRRIFSLDRVRMRERGERREGTSPRRAFTQPRREFPANAGGAAPSRVLIFCLDLGHFFLSFSPRSLSRVRRAPSPLHRSCQFFISSNYKKRAWE